MNDKHLEFATKIINNTDGDTLDWEKMSAEQYEALDQYTQTYKANVGDSIRLYVNSDKAFLRQGIENYYIDVTADILDSLIAAIELKLQPVNVFEEFIDKYLQKGK